MPIEQFIQDKNEIESYKQLKVLTIDKSLKSYTAFCKSFMLFINDKEVIKFSFDGKIYLGYSGDTLSSALLANGVHLMGRSFKYHRPRGILSSGSEEPNAIVTFDRGEGKITPNVRATTLEIFEGLQGSFCVSKLMNMETFSRGR